MKQLGLFNKPSFNISREMKECLATVVVDSGLGRDEFLDQLNMLADRYGIRLQKGSGRCLSKAMFEKWLTPTDKERMPPFVAIPLFCEIGKTTEPLQILANTVGAMVIDDTDRKRLLWAKAYHKAADARKEMKKLEQEI